MAKLTNPMLLIAFLLVASASVSKCQVTIRGRGLTCSNPSPLSGANVRLSCNGTAITIPSTTTTANGDFDIIVNPVPTSPPLFPLPCRVLIDVPSNCTIRDDLFLSGTVLRSVIILPVTGQPSTYRARFSV